MAKKTKKVTSTTPLLTTGASQQSPVVVSTPLYQYNTFSSLSLDKEEDRSPIHLLFSTKNKPIFVKDDFLLVEGKMENRDDLESNICLFAQDPYKDTYQKFRIGDKFDYVHIIRSDNKTKYLFTLKNCIVKRIEFKVGKHNEWLSSLEPSEQTIMEFEERVEDTEAEKLYNTVLGKK